MEIRDRLKIHIKAYFVCASTEDPGRSTTRGPGAGGPTSGPRPPRGRQARSAKAASAGPRPEDAERGSAFAEEAASH